MSLNALTHLCMYHRKLQMRVALLFYGRIAHYDKKYLLKSLPTTNEYDVFLSSDAANDAAIEDFIKIYAPISINNDALTYDVNFGKYPNTKTQPAVIHNMTCHFLNKKRVFGLLEQHIALTGASYEVVISTRLDLIMNPVHVELPAYNTIYIPHGDDYTGINDRFAMGDIEVMKKYMNIFDSCLYLLENKLSVPHPENLTLANIIFCNIATSRFELNASLVR